MDEHSKYMKIDFSVVYNIESAVDMLQKYERMGQHVCGSFNGIMLYSDTVTLDNAYEQITGFSKANFDLEIQRQTEEHRKKKEAHKKRIPELTKLWMEKGREVLKEDKWQDWDCVVPIRLNDMYQGMELESCLEIIEILNSGGSLEKAKEKIVSQDHSGASFSLVCSMVKKFSDRGDEFVMSLM